MSTKLHLFPRSIDFHSHYTSTTVRRFLHYRISRIVSSFIHAYSKPPCYNNYNIYKTYNIKLGIRKDQFGNGIVYCWKEVSRDGIGARGVLRRSAYPHLRRFVDKLDTTRYVVTEEIWIWIFKIVKNYFHLRSYVRKYFRNYYLAYPYNYYNL